MRERPPRTPCTLRSHTPAPPLIPLSLLILQVGQPAHGVDFDGRPYQVSTSLDLGLQQYLLKRMDRVNSRYIGIVAMAQTVVIISGGIHLSVGSIVGLGSIVAATTVVTRK